MTVIFLALALGFVTGALTITSTALYMEARSKNKELQNKVQAELDADAQQATILQYTS